MLLALTGAEVAGSLSALPPGRVIIRPLAGNVLTVSIAKLKIKIKRKNAEGIWDPCETVVVSIEQGWPFLFSTLDTVLLKLCKLHCTCNCMLSTPPPLNKILFSVLVQT